MTAIRFLAIPLLTLPLAGLAACDKPGGSEARAPAASDVMEGSISDAMLPLDSVRSQPPLAPRVEKTGRAGSKEEGDGKGDAGGDEAAGAEDAAGNAGPPPSPAAATRAAE
ncbi:MAG: hypothetical protein M0R03_16115 [Novosphingobium sp.]|nr:hypothetical protein [Novosphingobium sp.]